MVRARHVVLSTFHEPTLLEARVRRLVCGVEPPPSLSFYRVALTGFGALAIAAWLFGLPLHMHHATEAMIRFLP